MDFSGDKNHDLDKVFFLFRLRSKISCKQQSCVTFNLE